MGIYKGSVSISSIYHGDITVAAVYYGEHKVWPDEDASDLYSCYATGQWLDAYPWTDNDAWSDG